MRKATKPDLTMPNHHHNKRRHDGKRRRSPSETSSETSSRSRRRGSKSSGQTLEKFTEAIMRVLENSTSRSSSQTLRGDIVPVFNPDDRNQSAEKWCQKVSELRELYSWNEDSTIYFALAKLKGLAETWYKGLGTLNFTWEEWKVKLIKAFPTRRNFHCLLGEMMRRIKRAEETYIKYYHEKMALINACNIDGVDAVDCLLGGVHEKVFLAGANAGQYQTPEALLQYFGASDDYNLPSTSKYDGRFQGEREYIVKKKPQGNRFQQNEKRVVCYKCNLPGHYASACKERAKIETTERRCSYCNNRGHQEENCFRKKNEQNKKVALLKVVDDDPRNEKYFKNVEINDTILQAYIDFGSSCTIIRLNEVEKLNLVTEKGKALLCGYGSGKVVSLGSARFSIKVDDVFVKELTAMIVSNDEQDIPLLIGRNFTELPHVRVEKDKDHLKFSVNMNVAMEQPKNNGVEDVAKKIPLIISQDMVIPPHYVGVIKVHTTSFVGNVYVEGSVRMHEGKESCIPNLLLHISPNKTSLVPCVNLSDGDIVLKAQRMLARGWPCFEESEPSELVLHIEEKRLPPLNREDIEIGPISSEQKEVVYELLQEYRDCVAQNVEELGCAGDTQMEITLKDETPITYRPYRVARVEQEKINEIVKELLKCDIIQESVSEYSSPVVLVRKKNGEQRMCIDYRRLNSMTIQDRYPLPRIDDQIDRLKDGKYFTSLDLKSGYYQILMSESSKKYTAFATHHGLYEFNRMPFGLTNAPRCFQRFMNKVLGPINNLAAVYLDDVLLHSKTVEDAIDALRKILQIFREQNLTLNLKKCSFLMTSINFLGFEIEKDTVKPGKEKIKAVEHFPVPKSVRNIRQFLGLTGYFRQFVPDYALIAKPLTLLLKKTVPWKWKEEQDAAFRKLQQMLISRPVLSLYNPQADTEVHTDASSTGLAGILFQRQTDQKLHPVAYYSRQTSHSESKYHSYELETLAVVESLRKFRTYLLGVNFTLVTDCNALKATKDKKDLIPRVARWWLQLLEFNFDVKYRPGNRMQHVDALSRNVEEQRTGEKVLHITQGDWVLAGQLTDSKIQDINEILKRTPVTDYEKKIFKDYALRNGRVYRITARGIQWVVPRGMRPHVVRAAHDEMGHFAVEKTLYRLGEHYWFPSMRKYVEKYIASCIQCLFNRKKSGKKEGYLHPIPKGCNPMRTVHIDHLGPFPKSRNGNLYIIAVVDAFTKFLFMRAVKTTKTKYVLELLRDLFSTYGCPQVLISDQGSAFTAKSFAEFCLQNNVRHIKNAVATPRANGQVERLNRSILSALLTTTLEEENWDGNVKRVQFAINNVVNKTTGKTPSELLFGFRPRGGSDLPLKDEIEQVTGMVMNLVEEREKVSEAITQQQERQKKNFDVRRKKPRQYKEGDLIVLEKHNIAEYTSRKLLSPYSGPFVVKTVLPNDRYIVVDMPGSHRTKDRRSYSRTVAVDRMKPWAQLEETTDESGDEMGSAEDGVVLSDPERDQPEAC